MTFWEREPYVWEEDNRVSRFVALGAFGGEQGPGKKQRASHRIVCHRIMTDIIRIVVLRIYTGTHVDSELRPRPAQRNRESIQCLYIRAEARQ